MESLWYCFLYWPALNFLLIFFIGRWVLVGILYPYQNYIIRETLDRANNTKFGEDFIHFLECFSATIRSVAGLNIDRQNSVASVNQSRRLHSTSLDKASKIYLYDENLDSSISQRNNDLSVSDMKSVIELLITYSEVNSELINSGVNKSKPFVQVTKTLKEIIANLKSLYINLDDNELTSLRNINNSMDQSNFEIENMTVWDFFEIQIKHD